MKVYRGPKTKPFCDDSHERVATVSPEELAKGVKDKSNIQFNISKDGVFREAVCTVHFEDEDLIPMAQGLLSRLDMHQKTLLEVKNIVNEANIGDKEKISLLQEKLNKM